MLQAVGESRAEIFSLEKNVTSMFSRRSACLLFFPSPGARERERPWSGLVWSRASMTIENVGEGTGRRETLGTRLPG